MFAPLARRAAVWLAGACVMLAGESEGVGIAARVAEAGPGQAAATFVPARRLSGSLPSTPSPNVVGRLEEMLEIVVDATGNVATMTPVRASPLPRDPLAPAVANWRFRPAIDRGRVVPSRVLVAAIIRPPQLDDSPTLGDPPVDLAPPSGESPFPIATASPRYPPLAIGDGVVLVEVLVDLDGRAREMRIIEGTTAFGQASLDAASQWSFRPARWNGTTVQAYAYLVFGFRQPVVAGRPSGPPPKR